jgi:hypothetical protein
MTGRGNNKTCKAKHRVANSSTLGIFFFFLLFFLEDATCLSSSDPFKPDFHVISVNKNGGDSKTFFFRDLSIDSSPDDRNMNKLLDPAGAIKKFQSAIRSTFLPSGFPARTPTGYLKYSVWSWIQDLSTQLRSVLATQRVLEGVGVGREGATALSALMNYLVRDGCGMAATLLFTSAASSRFRADVKRWRLFADLMVDLGITLEVTAVLLPRSFFLPMICIGNMCKAICGVAAGACGGSINLHWSKGSDISDINAKFGAQHTVTGAMGLIFAALFARSVDHVKSVHLWTLYSSLTLLHIYANMQCMRLIAFDSCNTIRMDLLLDEFFPLWETNASTETSDSTLPELSNPSNVAKLEPLFFRLPTRHRKVSNIVPIHFGGSFNDYWERAGKSVSQFDYELDLLNHRDKYIVSSGWASNRRRLCVVVSLLSHVTPLQEAKGYFHANLLARLLRRRIETSNSNAIDDASRLDAEAEAQKKLEVAWDQFQRSCKSAGWDLSKTELRTRGYELQFVQ